jgi:GNAT superfamily N-acetyltransferase
VIEYVTLTKVEVDRLGAACTEGEGSSVATLGIPRSGVQLGAAAISRLACHQDLEPGAVRTIAAFDDGRMIGRLHVVYTDLLIEGRRLQRCAVGEDFFVLDEYRDRAVGLTLMLKALKLGFPFIESGVSEQMGAILDSWRQFVRVDASPIYQLALDWKGQVQTAKWKFYERTSHGGAFTEAVTKAALLRKAWQHRRCISRMGGPPPKLLSDNESKRAIERCLATPAAAVQLPWSKGLLEQALSGSDPSRRAWIVECAGDRAGPRLVSIYQQERVLRQDADGKIASIREAHLNEIYPPLNDSALIAPLVTFAADRAKEMSASVLQVHAMTPALRAFCETVGLPSRMTKSIYIAPDGVDPETRRLLTEPANWWCRAFNEDQFEEILVGRRAAGQPATVLV